MKKLLLLLLCGTLLPTPDFAQTPAEKIDPSLWQRMTAAPDEYQGVIIDLADYEDTRAMLNEFETNKTPLRVRSQQVITRLQVKAAATQPAVLSRLQQLKDIDAATIYPVWIVNAIYVQAKPSAIVRMAEWPEVGALLWNAPVEIEGFAIKEATAPPTPNGSEPGLRAIKAPFMWNLGYTGYGHKALVIDTGDDGEHPALVDNFWGHQVPVHQAWNGGKYPEDCGEHGTHVTGILCGLDRTTNDTIGVAFNAQWMGGPMSFPIGSDLGCQSAFTQTVFANTASMQWAINPDGDAATISDQPDVINCSWKSGNFSCTNTQAINLLNAVEAAGIAVVWAQGNDGPGASTVTSGGAMNMDLVNTFSVGAVNGANANFPIAGFSSRGPTPCGGTGSLNIKPEVCAPGVSVRSCVPGNTYQSFDGTSMAAPHAAGAIVLLREAFPQLSGIQLKMALYNSARDLGAAGEDNAYGMGIIDLQAAYNYLVNQGNVPVPPVPSERDILVVNTKVDGTCNGPVVPTITIENASKQTITSFQIQYGIENNTPLTYDWTGNLLPNTFTTVTLPGVQGVVPGEYVFVVDLANPNGQPDPRPLNNRFKRPFVMADAEYPTAAVTPQQSVPLCTNSRVLLEYTGTPDSNEIVQWFNFPVLGGAIATGPSYLTPPIAQTMNYYVSTSELHSGGKFELPASGNNNSIEGALEFNAERAFVLKSVKIYADAPGGRAIKLTDNVGTQVAYKLVSITQTGEQRITLNFNIPAGNGYRISVVSGNPLKHTSSQAGYPHQIPGVLNIYSGVTPGGFASTTFYYYFFDWQIEVPSVCGRRIVPVEVSNLTAPTVTFTASSDTVYLSNGGMVNFTDQTTGAVSWNWNFGNGLTSTDANPSTSYSQTGTYKVRLLASTANGCSNVTEKNIVVLQTSSASGPKVADEKVLMFPNPATDELMLGFLNGTPKGLGISLSDLLGRNIRPLSNAVYSNETIRLDIAALPPGVYIVHLSAEGASYWSGKFVKN